MKKRMISKLMLLAGITLSIAAYAQTQTQEVPASEYKKLVGSQKYEQFTRDLSVDQMKQVSSIEIVTSKDGKKGHLKFLDKTGKTLGTKACCPWYTCPLCPPGMNCCK